MCFRFCRQFRNMCSDLGARKFTLVFLYDFIERRCDIRSSSAWAIFCGAYDNDDNDVYACGSDQESSCDFISFDQAVNILRAELNYPEERALHFVKRFDHNKDGKLSVAEFRQFKGKIEETWADCLFFVGVARRCSGCTCIPHGCEKNIGVIYR